MDYKKTWSYRVGVILALTGLLLVLIDLAQSFYGVEYIRSLVRLGWALMILGLFFGIRAKKVAVREEPTKG